MSAAVLETVPQVPLAAGGDEKTAEIVQESSELDELADKMDSVKLAENSDPEKIIKHPLQNAWTLWFFKNDKSRSWEENQRPIITVTTVEDFWSLYNHIEVASRPAATTPSSRRASSLTGRTSETPPEVGG